jgi:hypothetical protein
VDGDADRAALVRDRPRHRLADPPGRVRRELVAAPVVELLHGADQPERALLDQIQERQAAPEITLRDGDHEPQVGFHHLLLGLQVPSLDPLRERHFALGGEERHAADRPQVQPQRVQARLDREVDLRLARGIRRLLAIDGAFEPSAFGRRRASIRADHVYALLLQIRVELGHLFLGDLDLLQTGGDLLEGQVPPFLPFGDERTKLLDLRDRSLALEQCFGLRAQASSFERVIEPPSSLRGRLRTYAVVRGAW